jgi:predicted nucleic acid-binding protein
MAADRIFIDTNVLIYANVEESPFHIEALKTIKRLHRNGSEMWLSRQVLREYLSVLSRPQSYSQPKNVATLAERILFFEQNFRIADDTNEVTVCLLRIMTEIQVGGKQVHDANIVATMLVNNVSTIVTHNTSDFIRFNKIISVVPII